MHAPVGVVISVSDAVPVILIQLSLKISKIAGPGFETLPCENVILPPPTLTGIATIFSSYSPRLSSAEAVPTISSTVSKDAIS